MEFLPLEPLLRPVGLLLAMLGPALLGWFLAKHLGSRPNTALQWHRARGRKLVWESDQVAVFDEPDDSGALRMLVFKSSPDLRQSEVRVRYTGTGAPLVLQQPLLASHVNRGLAMGIGLLGPKTLPALQVSSTDKRAESNLSAVVLGAGGCVLPCWLCSLCPACRVTAVENCEEVAAAAKACFGVDGAHSTLSLKIQDGREFIEASADLSFDLVFVTAGGKSDLAPTCVAPPSAMCSVAFAGHVHRVLRPGGVYATNILAKDESDARKALSLWRTRVVNAGFAEDGLHVASTSFGGDCKGTRNFVVFAASARDQVTKNNLLQRLHECGNPWLQKLARAERDIDSLVEWHAWQEFAAR